jgi:hypothetical protein
VPVRARVCLLPPHTHRVCACVCSCPQLIGLEAGADALPDGDTVGFTAMQTRLADATALKTVQDFVQAHTPELLACGHTKASANEASGAGRPFALNGACVPT